MSFFLLSYNPTEKKNLITFCVQLCFTPLRVYIRHSSCWPVGCLLMSTRRGLMLGRPWIQSVCVTFRSEQKMETDISWLIESQIIECRWDACWSCRHSVEGRASNLRLRLTKMSNAIWHKSNLKPLEHQCRWWRECNKAVIHFSFFTKSVDLCKIIITTYYASLFEFTVEYGLTEYRFT